MTDTTAHRHELLAPEATSSAHIAEHPDATLIHLCEAEHATHQAVNSLQRDVESDDDAVYAAWRAAAVALDLTTPQTLEGLAAKARAALRRGTAPNGRRNTDDSAGFAWAIVEDIIRMQGSAA